MFAIHVRNISAQGAQALSLGAVYGDTPNQGGNVALGYGISAGGTENTFINSGVGSVTGTFNTFVGNGIASNFSSGNSNTIIGSDSAVDLTTGSSNTIIGNETMQTGNYSNCLVLGAGAQPTANNQFVLGSSAFPLNVSTSATAGTASALPSTPSSYLQVLINGNSYCVPCYNT
jgi:hypothetical protein